MSKLPYSIQGGIFSGLLVLLVSFLKVTCPLTIGCFSDPFLIPLFSPLVITNLLSLDFGSYEPLYILVFWMVIGSLFGLLVSRFKRQEPVVEKEGDL